MAIGSDNPFPSILLKEHVDPATPPSGHWRLFVDTDNILKIIDDAGTVSAVGGGSTPDLDAVIAASSGQDIADALAGAAAPDSGNVFATMADVGGGGGGGLAYLGGLKSGTLSRGYTFTSTVESWTTSAGTLSSTGSKLRLTHSSAAIALEPSGAGTLADGEIECDFTNVSNTGSNGIIFRGTDSTHYYAWIFQTSFAFGLYKANGGGPSLVANGYLSGFPVGPTIHFLCRFVGSTLEAYMNGALIGFVVDSTFSTGFAGIRADNSTMDVDNLNVYSSPVTTGNVVTP